MESSKILNNMYLHPFDSIFIQLFCIVASCLDLKRCLQFQRLELKKLVLSGKYISCQLITVFGYIFYTFKQSNYVRIAQFIQNIQWLLYLNWSMHYIMKIFELQVIYSLIFKNTAIKSILLIKSSQTYLFRAYHNYHIIIKLLKLIKMKYLAVLALLGLVSAADVCPKDKQVECLTDINHAFDVCDKAAKQKGKDQQADLDCMKYFVAVQKDCWPCICVVAKQNGYKVKGCPQTLKSQ